MYVIGTAGHVDHGKSTLVKALTNIDPDRLPQEKEREMTIDLGFAWLTLPSGREVSIIDVAPTIMEAMGLPPLGEGVSLLPVIRGDPQPPRGPVFSEATKPFSAQFEEGLAWINTRKCKNFNIKWPQGFN